MKDLTKEWLEALRSGKYKQTRKHLHKGEGYCCLGVACEVAGIPSDKGLPAPDGEPCWTYLGYLGVLPDCLMVEDFAHTPAAETFIRMNDSGATFTEIADKIESGGYKLLKLE